MYEKHNNARYRQIYDEVGGEARRLGCLHNASEDENATVQSLPIRRVNVVDRLWRRTRRSRPTVGVSRGSLIRNENDASEDPQRSEACDTSNEHAEVTASYCTLLTTMSFFKISLILIAWTSYIFAYTSPKSPVPADNQASYQGIGSSFGGIFRNSPSSSRMRAIMQKACRYPYLALHTG